MDKEMLPIKVKKTDSGFICISQDFGAYEEEHNVLLHPEQVDLLVKWINEVKEELQRQ